MSDLVQQQRLTPEARRILSRVPTGTTVPKYGGIVWADLPDQDPRLAAAVVIAAECWRAHCSPEVVAEDLRRQLAEENEAVVRRIRETSWDVQAARSWQPSPSYAELQQRRASCAVADLDDPNGWTGYYPDPPARGQVFTRSELAGLPRVMPLVDGLLSFPAAVVLVGGYSLGKSALAHGIAGSVATGRKWLGREVVQRRVLVVVGEGAYGLDDRLSAWEYSWNDGERLTDDEITFLIKPNSLAKHLAWAEIQAYAVEGGYGLVILDTFSSLAPDADETKDAALIMRWLSDLSAAINGTALLVHHPGWSDSGRVRGGYQLEANADEVLVLAGVAEGSDLLSLTRKKVKDGPTGSVMWLYRRPVLASVIIESARADQLGVPIRERILTVLSGMAETGATGPQLMTEIGVEDKARSGFYKALSQAERDELIAGDGPRRARRYYLTEHAPKGTT